MRPFGQKGSGGPPLVETLTAQDVVPGIKVDTGAKPLAGFPGEGETVTEGLDGLHDRLAAKNYAMTDTPSAMRDRCHRSGGNDGKCSN